MNNIQKRRDFLKSIGVISASTLAGFSIIGAKGLKPKISKRDAIFNLIHGNKNQNYTPCGFFVHFDKAFKYGDAAVNKHLEYFNAIDMDFVKIQFEAQFPQLDTIKKPEDWTKMPLYGKDYYEKQLYVVKELVKKGKKHAPVIATLYSPFMSAGHTITDNLLTQHLKQDPENVKKGLDIITESTLIFANECIKLGVDGFLASTQGGEANRFIGTKIFEEYVKPYDLVVMNRINEKTECNVLHICDYVSDYDNLSPFKDYPGQIVNCSTKLGNSVTNLKDIQGIFNRPMFGGLEKRGAISKDEPGALRTEVKNVLHSAPEGFVLGAECALLGNIDWKQVRLAVDIAHGLKS